MTEQVALVDPKSNGHAAESGPEVRLKVTEERMQNLSVGIYRRASTSPDAQARFLAHFMTDENGDYLALPRAFAILDRLTVGQFNQAFVTLRLKIQGAAVPNP